MNKKVRYFYARVKTVRVIKQETLYSPLEQISHKNKMVFDLVLATVCFGKFIKLKNKNFITNEPVALF